ncbi:HAD family hydrolase [Oryzifoliimicrobium ureilyticus]|uniref:HAD family hydrolase n=1 Tax=Oryzifoliimicrobium ureilyticus TaxID=3113724 RepID=UPI0030761DF2
MIKLIVFDVGETLVNETRHWREWAAWLGVPEFTFSAVLGGMIATGRSHREVFPLLAQISHPEAVARRSASGWTYKIVAEDFYPDVAACLSDLRTAGFKIGIAGNQPAECETCISSMNIKLDLVGSSGRWGFQKPSLEFFNRITQESGLLPREICYVGDHPVNDIGPAKQEGMTAVWLRRGPWAALLRHEEAARAADFVADDLTSLTRWLIRSSP